jgi:antitoxin component YwqK of YwqJK toxin-antitoxin module
MNVYRGFILLLVPFFALNLLAQDPCSYLPTSKKGGFWVFSTFYQPNTNNVLLEGVCEEKNNDMPFLYREFKEGRLLKEVVYYTSGQLNSSLIFNARKRDTIIGEFEQFSEEGIRLLHEVYFKDKYGRRCVHRITYHINGNPRFDQYFAWVKEDELTDYQLPNHPPHTIDDQGYSYLMVPFGREQLFDESGQLIEEKYHQLLMDGSHEFASLNGPYLRFFNNGIRQITGQYKNGKLHGDYIERNYYGDTICKGYYDNGIKDGVWTYWHDNGQLKAVHHYAVHGKYPFHARKKEWSSSGKLILEVDFQEDGNGFLKEWSESGSPLHEQQLVNLSLEKGKEIFWFPNGQLKSFMDHTKDADTTFIEWYESGNKKNLKRKYTKDKTVVTSIKEWQPNGNLLEEVDLEKSEFVTAFTRRQYNERGQLKFVDSRKDREQFIEEYASNGIKIRSRKLLDGKLNGTYQELDSTGNLRLTCDYLNGLRHGNHRTYSPSRKLNEEHHYQNGEWIPKVQFNQSYIQLYRNLSVVNKKTFRSTAFALLNRGLYQTEPQRLSDESIDSMAAVVWQMSRIVPHYTEWYASNVSEQILRIRLIESYHRDLKTSQIWTDYSKELLAGLKQLNVSLPPFEFVYGEAFVEIPLKGWINIAAVKKLLPLNYNMFQLMHRSDDTSVDVQTIYPRCTIERLTPTTWKTTIPTGTLSYSVILYGDGTAEVENQLLKWSTFLSTDLTHENYNNKWHMHD